MSGRGSHLGAVRLKNSICQKSFELRKPILVKPDDNKEKAFCSASVSVMRMEIEISKRILV